MDPFTLFTTLMQIFILATSVNARADVSVTIATGTLTGTESYSFEGRPYNAYLGIPYAAPPINELRFKPPEPALPWDGILDATKDGQQCPQPPFISLQQNSGVIGQEDCLVVNVYRPRVKQDELLPVLAYIHGGGFYFGSSLSQALGPQKYMDEDIVLVTFNYRLGILGFLSTADENAYGNYGMLDQVQALRWIQQNIVHFGGDPDKVTIGGISAGAMSVSFLTLSPLTKGLFRAAIAQSGSALSELFIQKEPLFWAKKVAEKANCSMNAIREMVECMRSLPFTDLVLATESLKPRSHAAITFFPIYLLPVVEVPGGSGFLPENPMELLKAGRIPNKVPYIDGITKDEGFIFAHLQALAFKTKGKEFFDTEFQTDVIQFLVQVKPPKELRLKKISKLIQQEYFGAEQEFVDQSVFLERLAEVFSDAMFVVGSDATHPLMTQSGIATYKYYYTYKAEPEPILSIIFNLTGDEHINHGADHQRQFHFIYNKLPKIDSNDYQMGKIMNRVWANFAMTLKPSFDGAPVPDQSLQWLPFDIDQPNYMELSLNPTMETGIISKRTKFWTETVHHLANDDLTEKTEL